MGYASKQGRTQVNSRSPQASGKCDRCDFLYNHNHLRWQMDYSGAGLYNKRILVCEHCYDTPQQQLKVIVIPPDPMPIMNARPETYQQYETNTRYTQGGTVDFWTGLPVAGGDIRETQGGNDRVRQMTGAAPGSRNMYPGIRFTVPDDANAGVPYGSPGVPNAGRITTIDSYVVWTNNSPNPNYWLNNEGDQIYWGS